MRLGLLLSILVFGCGSKETSAQAHAWVEQGAALVDVRTAQEFAAGHLPGALNVPVQELEARAGEIPRGKVVVYCRSGARSARAARMLEARGYEVLDLGPKSAW